MFPDYHADLPLWGVDWYNPPLSRDLLQALCEWQEEWEADDADGMSTDEEFDAWESEGDRLAERVQSELGTGVILERRFYVPRDSGTD